MSTQDERMQILEMIESGKITPSEGLALLKSLDGDEPALPEPVLAEEPEESQPIHEMPEQPVETNPPEPAPPVQASELTVPGQEPSAGGVASGAWEADLPGEYSPPAEAQPQEPAPSTGKASEPPAQGEVLPPPTIGPDFARWRSFWQIPLWIGVGITVFSGVLMFLAWQSRGFGLVFACTWFPFLFGVAVLAVAWGTRNLPWLHIRVQQKPGERPQRIAISLPLPLGVISWGLRIFKHKIPNTGNVNLEEMVMALKNVSPEAPFSVDVDEGEDGEKVQIYIG